MATTLAIITAYHNPRRAVRCQVLLDQFEDHFKINHVNPNFALDTALHSVLEGSR
jgi:hypothetical protein